MKRKIFLVLLTVAITGIVCLWMAPSVQAVKTSGNAGENITWNFDAGTGTLSFTGSGNLYMGNSRPWSYYANATKTIIIGEGITCIGYEAFLNFREATSVSIPESLEDIMSYAFRGCTKLAQISLGDNLSNIGEAAFMECSSLTEFVIPDSVTWIQRWAFAECESLAKVSIGKNVEIMCGFEKCSSLTEITIPDNVQYMDSGFTDCVNLRKVNIGKGLSDISASMFTGCNNLEVKISQDNPYFCMVQGVIYDKSMTELVWLPGNFSGAYTVLPGTEIIGSYAASGCEGLTSIIIPDSVKTIEDRAFWECSGLSSVTLSEGLSQIDSLSFCRCYTLSEIIIPKTVTKIGDLAFQGCSKLNKITFTGKAPEIAKDAFFSVPATIYYPGKDRTWENMQDCLLGINLKWMPVYCEGAHQEQTVEGHAPTCTESGLAAGKRCVVCGEEIEPQTMVAATGHSYGPWQEIRAATGTFPGLAKRTCSACGKVEEKDILKLTDQKEGNSVPVPEPTEPSIEGTQATTDGVEPTKEENAGATMTPSTPTRQTEDTAAGSLVESNGKTKGESSLLWLIAAGVTGLLLVLGAGSVLLLRYRKREE